MRQFDEQAVLGRIVEAFWAGGFEATSIDDLERATGLKRQSLYNAFGAKPAMYLKALDHYGETVGAPIRAALGDPDPRRALRAFLDRHLDRMADPDCPSGCLMAGSCHELGGRDDELGRRIEADTRASEAALTATFQRWRDDGAMRPDAEPRRLARFVMALVRGAAGVHRATGDFDVARDAVNTGYDAIAMWMITNEQRSPE